jgi:uncharacterized protein (DUF1778 family)
MTQREERLERMDEWDDEGTKSPGQSASAVLSVRFSRDELGAVRAAAARNEQTVSEFVRTAALKHAQSRLAIHVSLVHSSGAAYAGTMYFPTPASRTQAASPLISGAAA